MLDLVANKEKFIQIFNGEIYREGKDALLNWLENSDFFEMPHTGQYTLSCKGGACLHALHTFKILTEMVEKYRESDPDFLLDPDCLGSEEERQQAIKDLDQSIAITALLHDIGNVNCWVEATKNVQRPDGKWEKVPGYKWDEELIYGHGSKAVFIIQQFMRLYIEEAQAIRFHAQGKEIPYGNTIEDTFYGVYETNLFAAMVGAAVNEASAVADKIVWDKIKPQD